MTEYRANQIELPVISNRPWKNHIDCIVSCSIMSGEAPKCTYTPPCRLVAWKPLYFIASHLTGRNCLSIIWNSSWRKFFIRVMLKDLGTIERLRGIAWVHYYIFVLLVRACHQSRSFKKYCHQNTEMRVSDEWHPTLLFRHGMLLFSEHSLLRSLLIDDFHPCKYLEVMSYEDTLFHSHQKSILLSLTQFS